MASYTPASAVDYKTGCARFFFMTLCAQLAAVCTSQHLVRTLIGGRVHAVLLCTPKEDPVLERGIEQELFPSGLTWHIFCIQATKTFENWYIILCS
eukprot:scaffold36958_cov18-Tisochrysis_lutea.AAC.3